MDVKKIKVDTSRFGRDEITEINRVKLTPAKVALDLGDGSERGEYVDQDYIINRLGRPHRNIGLMYTYYPNDKEWPVRSSEAYPDMEVHSQWEYPYDDYFVYEGGLGGKLSGKPFEEMRDIRHHGSIIRPLLCLKSKGIYLHNLLTLLGGDAVLINTAHGEILDEELVDSQRGKPVHGMSCIIPTIKISHDGNCLGMRGPDCKIHTFFFALFYRVCTKLIIEIIMGSFAKQILIILCN